MWNEAANDSARVSGQDRKNLPALGTNQIAGFRGFRPLASSEKNKSIYSLFFRSFVLSSLVKYNFNKEISSVYRSCSTDNVTIVCFRKVIELLPVKKRFLDADTKGTINFQERVM